MFNLRFETIDQEMFFPNINTGYREQASKLIVIANPNQITTSLSGLEFEDKTINSMKAVNFRNDFIIIVLRGLLGGASGHFQPEIPKITRQNDIVTVYAHYRDTTGEVVMSAFSSPFNVIKVSKQGQWGRNVTFILNIDSKNVYEEVAYIP